MDKEYLDDEELGTVVDQKVAESTSWAKLSKEREEITKYYNGELPKRTSNGSSSFVSTNVYDGVESMKAQLLETFAAGNKIVRFDPQGAGDVQDAKIATAYTDYVIFRQNDAYKLFSDVIDDGLRARVGVVEVFWDKTHSYTERSFENIDEDEAHGLASEEDVHAMDAEEISEGSGRYSGKMTRKTDKSQVRMEVINPEEFSVEPNAKTLDCDTFCCKQTFKTVADLIAAGYDKEKLLAWNARDDDTLNGSPEVLARFSMLDTGTKSRDKSDEPDLLQYVLITEAYMKTMLKGDDYPKLYKIVRLGDETLETEEIEELPFLTFVPLPIPHSFYGNSFAGRIIATQNATTTLTRSILDHTAITTNPRYAVLKGGLTNPKELMDNRLGGIVNTTRPDAVTPLMQANLNPYVFQTLELVKAHNEQTTGISSLSQGLNKDAISKQNSGAMVEKLVSLSQTRQKIVARNFANGFLIPLYIKVYNLILMKEKRKKIIDVTGEWHEVDVTRWKERRAASTALRLGYGEIEHEADTRVALAHVIAADPELNRSFSSDGRFRLAKDVFELKGISNFLEYMTPPDKLPPQQPDPMRMKEMELEERKVKALEMQAQAAMDKITANVQIDNQQQALAKMQRDIDNMLKQREEERKDMDIANKIDISQRETAILEATPMTSGVASASPR